jgi:hypothetical protein
VRQGGIDWHDAFVAAIGASLIGSRPPPEGVRQPWKQEKEPSSYLGEECLRFIMSQVFPEKIHALRKPVGLAVDDVKKYGDKKKQP